MLDYDIQNERVTLTAEQSYRSAHLCFMSCNGSLVVAVQGASIACANTLLTVVIAHPSAEAHELS